MFLRSLPNAFDQFFSNGLNIVNGGFNFLTLGGINFLTLGGINSPLWAE